MKKFRLNDVSKARMPWKFKISHTVDGVEVFALVHFRDTCFYVVELQHPYPGAWREGPGLLQHGDPDILMGTTSGLCCWMHPDEHVRDGELTAGGRRYVLETLTEVYLKAKEDHQHEAALMDAARRVLQAGGAALKGMLHPRDARALRVAWRTEQHKGALSKDQLEGRIANVTRRLQERRDTRQPLVQQLIKDAAALQLGVLDWPAATALLERALEQGEP